jgi:uncharacterized membrane protein
MHCTRCGTQMTDNSGFCQNCGQAASTLGAGMVGQPTATGAAVVSSAQTSTATALQPNIAGLLCYILGFVTGIFFLVAEPYRRDAFVRFHAYQSIFLSVGSIVLRLGVGVLLSIMPWSLWSLISTMSSLVSLAVFLVFLLLMYKAYGNERFKLPVIGDLAERQAGPV